MFSSLPQQLGAAAAGLFGVVMVSKMLGLPFTDVFFVSAVCLFACSGGRGGGKDDAKTLLPGMLRTGSRRALRRISGWAQPAQIQVVWVLRRLSRS